MMDIHLHGQILRMNYGLVLGHRIMRTLIKISHESNRKDPYKNTNENLRDSATIFAIEPKRHWLVPSWEA